MPYGNLTTISLLMRLFILCLFLRIDKYLLYRILCVKNFIFVYFPRTEFAGSNTEVNLKNYCPILLVRSMFLSHSRRGEYMGGDIRWEEKTIGSVLVFASHGRIKSCSCNDK